MVVTRGDPEDSVGWVGLEPLPAPAPVYLGRHASRVDNGEQSSRPGLRGKPQQPLILDRDAERTRFLRPLTDQRDLILIREPAAIPVKLIWKKSGFRGMHLVRFFQARSLASGGRLDGS